jgi:hypothetical protein
MVVAYGDAFPTVDTTLPVDEHGVAVICDLGVVGIHRAFGKAFIAALA